MVAVSAHVSHTLCCCAHGHSWLLPVLMVSHTFCCCAHGQLCRCAFSLLASSSAASVARRINMHHTGEHEQAHTHTQLLSSHTINMHHTGEHEQALAKHVKQPIGITQVSMSRHSLTHNSLIHIQSICITQVSMSRHTHTTP